MKAQTTIHKITLIILASSALTACGAAERINEIGKPPQQSAVVNPTTQRGYQPVSMPMPDKQPVTQQSNSLWTGAQQGFFKDQRAKTVGDILTVMIDINDKGKMENKTDRKRATSETAALPNLLGLEADLTQVLPEELNTSSLANGTADSSYSGDGTTDRKETIKMRLAVTITQVLPNGNMVIKGSQEVRINFENRILQMAGVVRPQDISTENTVNYDQVAEARIAYGGKGHITDVQQPRYGTQLYDVIFPF